MVKGFRYPEGARPRERREKGGVARRDPGAPVVFYSFG